MTLPLSALEHATDFRARDEHAAAATWRRQSCVGWRKYEPYIISNGLAMPWLVRAKAPGGESKYEAAAYS